MARLAPLAKQSNYSIEMLIKSMEPQHEFTFACLGPIRKKQILCLLPLLLAEARAELGTAPLAS